VIVREDPIFRKACPLLFAHRGGSREYPESTKQAFLKALQSGADILELDVRLTKDGTFVVWHGPGLDNVRILEVPDLIVNRTRNQNDLRTYNWKGLDGRAWVSDPRENGPDNSLFNTLRSIFVSLLPRTLQRWLCIRLGDVSEVPKESGRKLLRLEDFLSFFPAVDLNIEVKGRPGPEKLRELSELLEANRKGRAILLAFGNPFLLKRFRALDRSFPTSFSILGGLLFKIPGIPSLARLFVDFDRRAFQTSHRMLLRSTVRYFNRLGVPVHIFITPFLVLGGLDESIDSPSQEKLFKILQLGVNGIMTDRPSRVALLINRWRQVESRESSSDIQSEGSNSNP
jgi:glycerophosphoryl diester phosphodiesterase